MANEETLAAKSMAEALTLGDVDLSSTDFLLVASTRSDILEGICLVSGSHKTISDMLVNLMRRLPPEVLVYAVGALQELCLKEGIMLATPEAVAH